MIKNHEYYVYIVGSINDAIYIGVTNDLKRRVSEHKQGMIPGFTQQYKCKKLLYYEHFTDINDAIKREKQLKNWHREWKLNLIKEKNPGMVDLALKQ